MKWRCLSVQLPEPIDRDDDGNEQIIKYCKDHGIKENIAAVGIQRLKNVHASVIREKPEIALDTGLRVFRLDRSCFATWIESSESINDGELLRRMQNHANHLDAAASAEDVLFELLIKNGFSFTVPV